MITFDPTISLSDLIIFGGGVIAFARTYIVMRDALRDLKSAVGTIDLPRGLAGEVHQLNRTTSQHHEWLVRAGLDRKRAT